ncbi:MAG: prephenate dehydrogenase [Clostridia bacterium]|nr:prephenate dehydrogenase [Clostridia bacterium]
MKIGIVGLGQMGGSFAKALKQRTDHTVLGCDINKSTFLAAKMFNAIDDALTQERLGECDIVIVATYPKSTVEYMRENAPYFNKAGVIMDCGGTKAMVCKEILPLTEQYGFRFIGAHPMAGVAAFGFESSKDTMFVRASIILTPYTGTDIALVSYISRFCMELGFSRTPILSPEEHDEMIAYTSQLAHVVSNAYIQNPLAMRHKGYSAGSFRDLTRVAKLNADMWTELFLENADHLADEIDYIAEKLQAYSAAIRSHDAQKLHALLEAGTQAKIASEEREKEK